VWRLRAFFRYMGLYVLLILFTCPLMAFHVYAAVFPEGYAFLLKQEALGCKAGRGSPGMIDHSMTGIISVSLRLAEYPAHQPGVVAAADETGNLPIGGHAALRDFADYAENLVDEPLGKNPGHESASC